MEGDMDMKLVEFQQVVEGKLVLVSQDMEVGDQNWDCGLESLKRIDRREVGPCSIQSLKVR